MSSSRRSGEVDEAHEQLLQERLQILLERLRWSYGAVWTLNPQTRVLQWKRGHYFQADTRAGTASTSQPKVWYAQQFYTTYRSCSFTPGTGFVGRANLEGRHIWLSGDSVSQNAASLEQSQFLSYAKIKTVMCIPWLDSVLELGTTNSVGENFQLMDQIQQVLAHDLLAVPLQDDAAGFTGHDRTNSQPAATLQHHAHDSAAAESPRSLAIQSLQLPEAALNQPGSFQSAFDNLSDQVWRSDIFMQEQDSLPDLGAAWRAVGVGDNQSHNIAQQSTSHGLMNSQGDQYGSACTNSFGTSTTTATTSSSSVGNHGEYSNSSSARPANSASPELLHQHLMHALSPSISRSTAPDRTSSTVRLPQGGLHLEAKLEAYNIKPHATGSRNQTSLRRTTSCNDQYEIQKALSLFEAQEMQEQWRQQGLKPVAELDPNMNADQSHASFHSWQHGDDPTLKSSTLKIDSSSPSVDLMRSSNMNINLKKQISKIPRPLQRRHTLSAMEVLKEVETYQQEAALDQATSDMISYDQDYFQIQADQPARGPADVQMMNTPNLRPGRPRLTSSSRGAGHNEAAVNHMLAERRRRVKQKENFATLRRLVPIISKADKASTLVDAIVYLKDLQNTIVEMEANKKDMDQRCEDLASQCMKLEEQNKELVAILSKDKPNPGIVHLSDLKLHSMKSI